MATNNGLRTAAKAGWAKSREKWMRLTSMSLERRGITPHMVYIEKILQKIFENNSIEGGNIGWETVDSYVGYLQATDQLGVPIKSHSIEYHRDVLNWAPRTGGKPKRPDPGKIWGGKPRDKSTAGTRMIRSKWGR